MPWILFEWLPSTCDAETLARNKIAGDRIKELILRDDAADWFCPVGYTSLDVPTIENVGPRKLSRIVDLMEYANFITGPDGDSTMFGFINSDIYISNLGFDRLKELDASDVDIALLSRTDVPIDCLTTEDPLSECRARGRVNHGISADGWLVRRKAWLKLREWYPKEMLIGEPWWDTCAIALSTYFKDQFKVVHLCKDEFLHPAHDRGWSSLSSEALRARREHIALKVKMRLGEVK